MATRVLVITVAVASGWLIGAATTHWLPMDFYPLIVVLVAGPITLIRVVKELRETEQSNGASNR